MSSTNKHIFILYGAANTGKTTTLNSFFNQLCNDSSFSLIYFKRHENKIDFITVLENGGNRIGIYSAGDTDQQVRSNLYDLYHHNCRFIFGTARTRGGSCSAIESYAKIIHSMTDVIEWIKKIDATNSDNQDKANKLLDEAKELPNYLK